MKIRSSIGIALATSCLLLALSESRASAAYPWPACSPAPTPPNNCTTEPQYQSGVISGQALVWSVWTSKAINKDCSNWDTLKQAALNTIPTMVTNYVTANQSQLDNKVQCRAQGLIDGASCEMTVLPDCPKQCAMDGIDWGYLSAEIYCELSVDLGGLGDVPPWFTRPNPNTTCPTNFEHYCDSIFEYGANSTAYPLPSDVFDFVTNTLLQDTAIYQQSPYCAAYTVDPWKQTFLDNEYVSCSYDVP